MSKKKHVFGIDLGTTTSSISLFRNNSVEIIKANGHRLTDSMVCYDIQEGTPHVGKSAQQSSIKFDKNKNLSGIKNCIYDVKRFIGRSYSDPRIQDIYKRYPFEVAESDDGQVQFRLQCANGPLSISPQQVSSKILKYLKKAANNYISCDEEEEIEAVITVPAYFDISQRKATVEAADLAGIKVLKLLNEPTAAALHHLFVSGKFDTTLLVFDFGGGTFDVSVIEADISKTVTVVATAGDPFLGGRDIDNNIFQYMQSKINQKLNERIVRRLQTDAETMKTHLTQYNSASSEVLGDMDIDVEITRDIFNGLNKDIFAKCIIVAKECLKQANKESKDIKEVLLVGGSSLIPELESLIEEYFHKSTIVKSQDRTEIVCYGAALQASMIKGILNFDLKISDIMNISLGYEAAGGEMIFIFKKQSKLPITVNHKAVTMIKDQKKIVVNLYEGERKCILYNSFLEKVILDNLPPGPPGSSFTIKFTINESGILEVAINYDEDHAKNITLDLNTSKLHNAMLKLEPGINSEDLDRKFLEFNTIKTKAIYYCKLYMNMDTTSQNTKEKLGRMLQDTQSCKFEETSKHSLAEIIRSHAENIDIPQFTKNLRSEVTTNDHT